MRQLEVGGLGALVPREHRDHRPACAAWLEGLDEDPLLALGRGRIGARWRQWLAAAAALEPRCDARSDQCLYTPGHAP